VKINRGILTGCNDAFIISGAKRDVILSNCKTDHERQLTTELIRPILRDRDIKRYGYEFADQYLIALFPSRNYDIDNYSAIKEYLSSAEWSDEIPNGHGMKKLEQTGKKYIVDGVTFTARKKTGNKWFETQDQINYWDDFSQQKIVWGNLNLSPKYALAESGMFVNAPSPMIVPGTPYLLAFLNSTVCDWYFKIIAVERSGGFFEYKPMFIEQLPLPKPTSERQNVLVPLVEKLLLSYSLGLEQDISQQIYAIFGFTGVEMEFIEKSQY
jgi:hypothetical protein